MTRPGIVRADTLDLQNPDSPSSQDHSKNSAQHADFSDNLIGAHQAAEVRHVIQERHTEEQNLQDAWTTQKDDGMQTEMHDANGLDGGDDTRSSVDSDADAASDDDMMDRMSSSPSIDDGAYHRRSPAWPERSSSLTPTLPSSAFSAFALADSSSREEPTDPLILLPVIIGEQDSPASTQRSSSPYAQSPEHLPLWVIAKQDRNPNISNVHHLVGEYATDEGFFDDPLDDTTDPDESNENGSLPGYNRFITGETSRAGLRLHYNNHVKVFPVDETPQFQYGRQREEMSDSLLPGDDSALLPNEYAPPLSPTGSSGSWQTMSDDSGDIEQGLPIDQDDDAGDISFYTDDRFVDSGWGGECLRETEDIDFDFVYALHTFVATVEGQANATKGDTMVLLDDSNSYWWLVRVVKDSSIGYLPAEHIETPTERLARLNKHRNVDLSAAMLGDNSDKAKNPIKKVIRRRTTKQVQFAAPTYVEASDYDYSSDEEDEAREAAANGAVTNGANGQAAQQQQVDNASIISDTASIDPTSPTRDIHAPVEEPLGSPKLVDKTEAAPLKSRKGTPRNSDSWLKEETGETRKLTLTPNLLRDDNGGPRFAVVESTPNASMETLEKTISPPEKPKEDKKKKEKKSGMLSGLFKNKKKEKKEEKARKREFVSENDVERVSVDAARLSTGSLPAGDPVAKGKEVQRKASQQRKGKLQKSPSSSSSLKAMGPGSNGDPASAFVAELEGSQVAYEAPTGLEDQITGAAPVSKQKTKKAKRRQVLDDFDDEDDEEDETEVSQEIIEPSTPSSFMHGTEAVHIPLQAGEGDSSEEEQNVDEDESQKQREASSTPPSLVDPPQEPEAKPIELSQPLNFAGASRSVEPERTMESVTAVEPEKAPLPIEHTTHSIPEESVRAVEHEQFNDDDATPVPSKPQSPIPRTEPTQTVPFTPVAKSAMDHISSEPHRQDSKSSTVSSRNQLSPSPASTNTTWSDAGLRAWLDGDNDIRDMLVVIHDKSCVKPVDNTHPLMMGLYAEETKTLKGLSDELDSLLGGVLGRKTNGVSTQV